MGWGCLPGPSAAVTVTTVYLPGYPSGNPPVPLELVSVSPGSFQMGSVDPGWSLNNEQPVHTVNIAYPLQVGRFEVTQRQWVSLMHSNPSYWTGDDTRPVEQVTWLDVCGPGGYLEKLNQYIASTGQGLPEFRLPSEAEWEYACRGGSTTRFYFGDSDCASSWICNACSLGNYGWFCGNSGGTPHVVGGKLPNAFGLYDMLGNVSEWCQDIILPDPLLPTYVGAPTDGSPWYPEGPAGTLIKRVHRGGFYYGYPTNCRSATRSGADSGNPGVTDFKSYSLGFRLARFEKSVVTYADNTFATGAVVPPGGTGWTSFGFNTPGFAYPDYNAAAMAYRCWVATDPTKFRDVGLNTNPADWLPYSIINGNRVVRAKYMIYAGGQSNPADQNQVPNMRLRLCNRFAINSMLEVFNHDPNDAAAVRSTYAELRPSTLPASPSVFRVDLDPIDIPYLYSNSSTEGFQRGFEAYAIYPADQGYLAMTESVIGSYPSTLMPSSIAPVKTYATDPTNAGDLAVYAVPTSSELSLTKLIPGATEGAFATTDPSAPQPTYSSGNWGVTLDTTTIPSDRIGVATRNFNPDRGTNAYASRVARWRRGGSTRFASISSRPNRPTRRLRSGCGAAPSSSAGAKSLRSAALGAPTAERPIRSTKTTPSRNRQCRVSDA